MSVTARRTEAFEYEEVTLTYEFPVDPKLALAWVTQLIARPRPEITPAGYVWLLSCRQDFGAPAPGCAEHRLPAQLPARGRALLQSAFCEASTRNGRWWRVDSPSAGYASRLNAGLDRLPDEIWQAISAPTNLPGTVSQVALLLDALYQSLPLTFHVQMAGGKWELYDANANARKNAFGKAAKLRMPPRMSLRARGVRMPWLVPGARMTNGALRMTAPGAKTVAEGLRIARANAMKLIPRAAHSALPLRGVLGGNAVGLALTVGPQAYVDARSAGVLDKPGDAHSWKQFGVASAKNQSGNIAGVLGGMVVGAVFAWAGVTAAPLLICVALAGGALSQAGFNAWGLNDEAEKAAKWLLGP